METIGRASRCLGSKAVESSELQSRWWRCTGMRAEVKWSPRTQPVKKAK